MNDIDFNNQKFIFEDTFKNIDGLLNKDNKVKYAQYYTGENIAVYMANMLKKINKKIIRLLDPGCGVGILTAAFLHRLINMQDRKVSKVIVTMYEIDKVVIPRLEENMKEISDICNKHGLALEYCIINDNLIRDFYDKKDSNSIYKFDYIIMNPPYMKLVDNSDDDVMLENIGINVTNYYAAFVSIAIRLLESKGELVAITPRSFCNGVYFLDFRKDLLENVAFDKIHLFESRKDLFREDEVLQENVIFHCTKRKTKKTHKISIIHSYSNLKEGVSVEEKRFEDVVFLNDGNFLIRIIRGAEEEEISKRINSLECSLEQLGIQVSTGPVVDFREPKETQSKERIFNGIPFFFSEHISIKGINWPKPNGKKYNYIILSENNKNRMRKNGNYVLVKRMTSKEETRRIVSAVCEGDNYDYEYFAFDNKVNYFHHNKEGLPIEIAKGLCIYLNSTIVDRYFRTFSGNTQVNANDLRSLSYPTLKQLKILSERYDSLIGNQELIDREIYNILF
ncbi:Eco57I restriction-modification methylase domain-containing protein [Clostridium botulinum]|uniref:Eco57I restriction-modification methylase domain-containing protein n=1 Tax=Clostridium botulinum TaxID=1491 RepID=UPI001967B93C|nr:Eco57I restriction-modification methylase domain-containing protein [Clostridium botulinum]